MIKAWTDDAWDDYMYWHQQNDKRTIKRINKLVEDIDRHPFEGIGKPEPLKYELTNTCSRRITQEHRLIYQIENDTMYILSVRDHY
ncbi:Txe/YoeB family addiction module toxin [Ligilactobacillus pabuli]|uniref:Endoribonuclease YoeB n=1 Tax=Ligilactobacillus pabuli TaxID=2886039 RepID=A0ABQ5JJC6_9LACO|nr:Txe/YoeB family addiction module toxin [Ligilactobacillus pabuli]GKS81269.1 Txe/YoeB family addiction module toxin [Ligilactobacillus pabuli]HIW89174.1 Txe/YoeB family addiction module toxin [Candidatus Ligilactobacillus excrementipullorum]